MTVKKQVSLHGNRAFITQRDTLVGRGAIATGGEDKATIILPGGVETVAQFDDFLGDVLADEWNYVEPDTGHTGAINAQTNGVFRINLSATATATPAAGALINSGALQWKAKQGKGGKNGNLRLSARVKLPKVVAHGVDTGIGSVFIGFTDITTFEFPIYDTGNSTGPISPAADAVGFLWGSRADTGWTAVAVKSTAGDSGDQQALTGVTPTQNVWQTLEIDIHSGISDTGGSATFYINGVPKARINSPVASATALTPVVAICQLQANANTSLVDIDYLNISAPRDTGD